ncbi:MAG: HPr family phosphocarrier protein [bacterium]|nr:HPr family phosphocarrier protein [bacterium]
MIKKTDIKRIVVIKNTLGLHARPAALFVQLANKFQSEIFVEKKEQKVNGKSIMGIMTLAAGKGQKITIIADGNDAEKAVKALEKLLKDKFGEE